MYAVKKFIKEKYKEKKDALISFGRLEWFAAYVLLVDVFQPRIELA